MKHITRKFDLFQDEETGTHGIAIAGSKEHGFNAFWDAKGIFHDCFEHFFEGNPKHPFHGAHSYTVFGEIAALGAAMYYYDIAHVHNRPLDPKRWDFSPGIFREVWGMLTEWKHDDYREEEDGRYFSSYPVPMPYQCPVTRQRQTGLMKDTGLLDEIPKEISWQYGHEENNAKEYNLAVRNLMRWGARQAEKLSFFGMDGAIEDLETFVRRFDAEELSNLGIDEIQFRFKIDRGEYVETQVKFDTPWNDNSINTDTWLNAARLYMDDIYQFEEEY